MKIYNIKILLLTLLATVFVGGCNDESLFTGADNYITSFLLKQGDITLYGAISTGSIVLNAPEGLSLQGAVATVVVSENASIEPAPLAVTNWDEEQTFTVTAYNGTKNVYTYSVQRTVNGKEGDITLLNQADVETLAALNITRIDGSLIIGAATGGDSVYSLAPLASLKTVTYDIIINATYAGKDIAGLENLEKAGSLQILQNKTLESVALPKLASIMSDLNVNQSLVKTLDFPELTNVDKGLLILTADSLVQINFPKLKNVVENMTLQGSWSPNKLRSLTFPVLEKVGGNISITNWKETTEVEMPLLLHATAVTVSSLPEMTTLAMPKLALVLGNVSVSSNTMMKTINLASLQHAGGDLRIESHNELENLDGLKALSSVGGEVFITALPKLKNIEGLKALKSIGKRAYFSNWPLLDDPTLSGLSGLSSVGGDLYISQVPFRKFSGLALSEVTNIYLYGNGLQSIEEIDLSSLDIKNTLVLANISTPFALKGKKIFNGNLILEYSHPVAVDGFEEVGNLTYSMNVVTEAERILYVRKVTGNASILVYNFGIFKMPLLEEVAGTFKLSALTGMQTVELPKLERTGATTLDVAILQSFALPALQYVDGDCAISTGRYQADNLADIRMPSLKTVNGTLSLTGYSSYYFNSKLTNLDGFTSLENVKGITVSRNVNLTDFTGLKNTLGSFDASGWKVSDNGYNPTYQEMVEGKYVKP